MPTLSARKYFHSLADKMKVDDKDLANIGVFKKVARKLYVEYLEKGITHGLRMIRRTEGDSYGR